MIGMAFFQQIVIFLIIVVAVVMILKHIAIPEPWRTIGLIVVCALLLIWFVNLMFALLGAGPFITIR